jgi:hypothetical protein
MQLVRRYRLPADSRDDLRHDLLVDLFARLPAFDPRRGHIGAFAAVVIRHCVTRIAARLRRIVPSLPPFRLTTHAANMAKSP